MSYNTLDQYLQLYHFVTEISEHVYSSVTKWRIVGYRSSALWDLCNRSIRMLVIPRE